MPKVRLYLFTLLMIITGLISTITSAGEIRVAVASNFYPAIKEIALQYELKTTSLAQNHKVILIPGSSGKHYSQILNGAPFDVFLSADSLRPSLLERKELSEKNSRFTYAIGRLVLWSPKNNLEVNIETLFQKNFRFLAIANPKIAPYGIAAKDALTSLSLWKEIQEKIIRGENIAQTFQFVDSGNAKLGFVSYSQLVNPNYPVEGSFWEIPQNLYRPIEQQAVLLKDSELGKDFLAFLQTEKSLNIITKNGYRLP